MKKFFLFSLAYFMFAMAVLYIFRENPGIQIWDGGRRTQKTLVALAKYLPYLLVAFIGAYLISRHYFSRKTMIDVGWALCGCLLFSAAFTFMKTSLPSVIPFYADPFFAQLDKAIHGGVDPWVLTHKLQQYLNPNAVGTLYFAIWGLPAAFFPILLAAFDRDPDRTRRFLLLYVFVWIGLGNVIAYLGSSVGPVYYDRLMDTDRFVDLLAALHTSGITDSHLGMAQNGLWHVFTQHEQMVGSGISAFPSVHNGVATLVMLYLWERSKWLAPVGIAFSIAIMFCSVYVGWHYAIDAYFSIIAVTGIWYLLRVRSWAPMRQKARGSSDDFNGPAVA